MDLGEIFQECGRLLNDPNNDRWNQTILTFRANQAQTIVQGYTKAVKSKEVLTATAGLATVNLDTDTMDVFRVSITRADGNKEKLEGIRREELDFRYPNWENLSNGRPEVYWFDGTNGQINLVPKPDAGNAVTNGIQVWEVLKPADMIASADLPFDGSTPMIPYHLSIIHWVVAQCWLDDGTPEALAKSQFHRSGNMERPGEFEKQIIRIVGEFDAPSDIPARILWKPQGGRLGRAGQPSKSYPFSW